MKESGVLDRKKYVGFIFLILCFFTYLSSYLLRTNISRELGNIGEELNIGSDKLGVFGSGFFIIYAIGQFISGIVGDRAKEYRHLAITIFSCAALNFGMTVVGGYVPMVVIWIANGFAESMVWGVLLRTLLKHIIDDVKLRSYASLIMALGGPIGYLLSWSVISPALSGYGWRASFIFPAVAAVPVIIAWFVLYLRKAGHREEKKSETQTRSLKEMLQVAKREKLAKYAVVCVFEGMIRDSVVFWAPILIGRIFVKDSSLTLTIIPLSMIVGQIIARTVGTKARNNFIRSLSLIILGIVISSAAMILLKNAIFSAIIMGIDIILTQIIATSMTVVVPIAYIKENMTAFVAGFMDASHYLGAAIASFGLGVVLTGDNWEPAALVWLLTSVAGLIYCLTVLPERRRKKNDGDQDDNRTARQKEFA